MWGMGWHRALSQSRLSYSPLLTIVSSCYNSSRSRGWIGLSSFHHDTLNCWTWSSLTFWVESSILSWIIAALHLVAKLSVLSSELPPHVLVMRRRLCMWPYCHSMLLGATAQEKFKALPFSVKIQGLGLNWLCLAMALSKALFWEWCLSSGWKPNIYDRETTALVHCYLLGGITFGEDKLLVLFRWC
jgi:hypothetical protein